MDSEPVGSTHDRPWPGDVFPPLRVILLAVVGYGVGGLLAFAWFEAGRGDPVFFPGAGVSLGLLVCNRVRHWPAILTAIGVTEFLLDVSHGSPPGVAAGYMLVNTAEPLVGAALLRRVIDPVDLSRRRNLAAFVVCAALVGPLVGASLAVGVQMLVAGTSGPIFWLRWLLGDALGVLVIGGAIISWQAGGAPARQAIRRPGNVALVVACVAASATVFVLDEVWVGYLLIALLVVVAFRTGTAGVAVTGAGMATVVGQAAVTGHFTAWGETPQETWLSLNLAIGFLTTVMLVLAGEIAERDNSLRQRQRAEDERVRAEVSRRWADAARADAEARAEAASERVRLLEGERAARRRAEMLQTVTVRLSGLRSHADIVTTIAQVTRDALGSDAAVVVLPDATGAPELIAAEGHSEIERRRLADLITSGADLPVVRALSTGTVITETTRSGLVHDFPQAATHPKYLHAVAAAPCVVDGRPIGALGWAWTADHTFDDDLVATLTAVAGQAAMALERSRLFELDLHSRAQLAAVQDTVVQLAAAVTPDQVLAAVLGPGVRAVGGGHGQVAWQDTRGRMIARSSSEPDPDDGPLSETSILAAAIRAGQVRRGTGRDPDVGTCVGCEVAVPFASTTLRGGLLVRFEDRPSDAPTPDILLTTLAQTVGQALDRALATQREHEVAVQLQLSLLGRPDVVPRLEVATVYRPGTQDLQVGGDWYDVIALPDGRAGVVIGDVIGHSLTAAGAMGQLRSIVRTLAPLIPDPAELMSRLDVVVEQLEDAQLATVVYGVLDPGTGHLRYANAGHPPPLLIPPAGSPSFLDDGHGLLLGTSTPAPRRSADVRLAPGDALLLYTDGLVERPDESLTVSLAELVAHAGHAARHGVTSAAAVLAALTSAYALGTPQASHLDDVAVLVVTCAAAFPPAGIPASLGE